MKSPIRFEHIHTVVDGARSTYMRRLVIGRLNLHLFYRGDSDDCPHDHPWSFWTFPLRAYVEEVFDWETGDRWRQVVPAWRWSFRPATHAHRVLGRLACDEMTCHCTAMRCPHEAGKFVTIVWKTPILRSWGFWRGRSWVPWREYLAGRP
jgi:hypothetical protein